MCFYVLSRKFLSVSFINYHYLYKTIPITNPNPKFHYFSSPNAFFKSASAFITSSIALK